VLTLQGNGLKFKFSKFIYILCKFFSVKIIHIKAKIVITLYIFILKIIIFLSHALWLDISVPALAQ